MWMLPSPSFNVVSQSMLRLVVALWIQTESNYFNNVDLTAVSISFDFWNKALRRGAFCQFPFRWVYYCHSSKFTGKETGKTHLCAVHGIQKLFWPKDFFWSVMKMTFTKNIPIMSQGPPNPGFRYLILENWDFLKKDSQDFKNSFWFGFLWILSKTGEQN